jgi:hypothetical protein
VGLSSPEFKERPAAHPRCALRASRWPSSQTARGAFPA